MCRGHPRSNGCSSALPLYANVSGNLRNSIVKRQHRDPADKSLTHNTEDFHELHRERPGHRGIMAVYRDADPRKNMNHAQIAAAIRRLETSGVTIAGGFHLLNHWR
jgi:hypothetical protein